MTMTQQIQRKKKQRPSDKYQQALDAIPLPDFEKLQPKVDRAVTIGKAEGISDKQIGKDIRKKMRGHYGATTMWRVFEEYPECRQKRTGNISKKEKIRHPSVCPTCGKSIDDAPNGYFQMSTKDFKIEEIDQYDRGFIIAGYEDLYAKYLKLQSRLNPNIKNKKTKTVDQQKTAIVNDMVKWGNEDAQ